MRIIKPAAIVAALLFILSCNHAANEQADFKTATKNAEAIEQPPPSKDVADNSFTGENKNAGEPDQTGDQKQDKQKQPVIKEQAPKPDWDKKIIKTASVNIEVEDYNKYYASLREKVKSMGGYIAQEEQSQSDYKIENSMIIKVPVDQFDNAVVLLSDKIKKINERKITSQDVTTEVVDTRSRIEAKKQVRQRYMDLLGQAKNMQDILSVQSEINGIQEEIESAAGRIEYLSHSSVFSTISLTYYQVLNAGARETGEQPKPSFGEKLKNALGTGWEIVSNLFIGIITLWPLLLGSFFAYLLYKKMRTHKPKQA
ncbi:MAG: DUF4349 domain-containing protein [Bacteroidota bacterium]